MYIFVAKYLLIPLLVVIATIPAWIVTQIANKYYEAKALKQISTHNPLIIGITGSYGKTSTKFILGKLLKAKYSVWYSPKSFNTPFSIPKSIATTYAGEEIMIIEFAAYKRGEIARLTKLFPPKIGIVTGLASQHLDIFGSFSNIIKAKQELPQSLPNKSKLYINHQVPEFDNFINPFKHLSIIKPVNKTISKLGLTNLQQLKFNYQNQAITTKIIGQHYLSNIELAIAVAHDLNLTPKQIAESLASFKPGDEFISIQQTQANTIIIHDGKTTNPKGFTAAISLASKIKATPKLIITSGIIDLGSESSRIHQQLASEIKSDFDYLIDTSATGQPAFKQILGLKYLTATNLKSFEKIYQKHLSSNGLLLIEGKIPTPFIDYLTKLI